MSISRAKGLTMEKRNLVRRSYFKAMNLFIKYSFPFVD